jgi:hypothetical protein
VPSFFVVVQRFAKWHTDRKGRAAARVPAE